MPRNKFFVFITNAVLFIMNLATRLISLFLRLMIQTFRPLLGPATCKYPIGCTQYALEQLNEVPLSQALWNIVKRVFSCI